MKIKDQLLLSKKPTRNNFKAFFYCMYLMDSKIATTLNFMELLGVSLLY